MDNVAAITQEDLNRYMGLNQQGQDASGSKTMTVANNQITYAYTRGGVTLTGTIDIASQSTTWVCTGVAQNQTRQTAIAEGLKVNTTNNPNALTFN